MNRKSLSLFVWDVDSSFLEDMRQKYSSYSEAIRDINVCAGGVELTAKNNDCRFCYWIPNGRGPGVGNLGFGELIEEIAGYIIDGTTANSFQLECTDERIAAELSKLLGGRGILVNQPKPLDLGEIEENMLRNTEALVYESSTSIKH